MALIKCPECGKEVSDKAQTCINCGCPIAEQNTSNEKITNEPNIVTMVEDAEQKANKKLFISMILNAIATVIIPFVFSVLNFSDLKPEETTPFIYFLIDNQSYKVILFITTFVSALLTYLIKDNKKKILAITSVILSIISCLLCCAISFGDTRDRCALFLLTPSAVLYFVYALMTMLGIKEYYNAK